MATVTGLTKERMLAIEAASVVSGTIDASGHLILTTHDGAQIDAGYALVAVPDASDTKKGIVELATDAETAAHTDTTRAVTPANLAATIVRIDTLNTNLTTTTDRVGVLEAKPGDKVQIIAAPAENATGAAYPIGVSLTIVASGSGWSLNGGTGTIMTVQQSLNRLYQTFTSADGGAGLVQMWARTYHNPEGWTSWAQIPNSSDPSAFGMTGEIKLWPGATVPNGWRLCDGTAINRTTFAKLFAILSTTYGAGDGTTTFNVPDMRGRTPVGVDAGQTEFNTMGKVGGAKTHTLSVGEMPTHYHSLTVALSNVTPMTNASLPSAFNPNNNGTGLINPGIMGTTGDNGAHNNLQPYIALRYIIKL